MQFKFPYMFRVFLICVLLGCSIQCVPKENNKEDDKKNDLIIFSLLFSSSAKIDSISPELVFENSKITITGSRFIQSGIQKILIDSKFEVIPDSITETEMTARIPSGLIWSGLIPVSLRGTNFQDVKRIHFEKNHKLRQKLYGFGSKRHECFESSHFHIRSQKRKFGSIEFWLRFRFAPRTCYESI